MLVPEEVPLKVPDCVARVPRPSVVRWAEASASSMSASPAAVALESVVMAAGMPVRSAQAGTALSVLPERERLVPRVMAAGVLIDVGQPSSRPTAGVTGRTSSGPLAGFWLSR